MSVDIEFPSCEVELLAKDLRDLTHEKLEKTVIAYGLLKALKERDGRLINIRMVEQMGEELDLDLTLRKDHSTRLEWGDYWRIAGGYLKNVTPEQKANCGSFWISGETKHVRIDAKLIEDRNACYLSAANLRNCKRMDFTDLDNDAPEKLAGAIIAYREARETINKLLPWDHPDRYDIEKKFAEGALK